jgi:hypothetical protein|tara:strand:- start:1262 stop:1483 length:222 start_codon:yes stop_codon:yes gene_type:complete
MSTIIIPGGGGMGLSIMSLIGNLIALYILARVAMYLYKDFDGPSKSLNVVDFLKSFNIDASGLFASKYSKNKK